MVKPNARKIAKDYLEQRGIKQSYIAKKMGVSDSAISNRLNGRLKFDANFAIAFSKTLGISPDIFLK